jgi:uncharacterized SAM-binding protein YcdF (DUF218 family)
MYNLASKLLAPLFDPLALAILLAVCALLAWKRRRLAAWLSILSLALLLAFSCDVVARALMRPLEDQSRDSGLDVPSAQAIVVLGGAIRMPSGIHHSAGLIDSSDRLLAAYRLYRGGKAPLIFCSGGNNPMSGQSGKTAEAVRMARLLEEWNVPSAAIQVEGESINTRENAIRSYQALAPRGIRRILLVTSAFHMPRAAGAFRKVGFEVIAAPADFHAGWEEPDILSRWLPRADNLVYSETALHEWLGLAIYRLRGWI